LNLFASIILAEVLKETANVFSAGTEIKDMINQDAVRLMKQLYNIDMEATQKSKLIIELPQIDYVITMGCNVNCPRLPCKKRKDWGLDDPSGKADEEFKKVINTIKDKLYQLKEELQAEKLV
jgi:arsenate reductase